MTIPKLSPKKLEKLEKQGKLRDSFELWVDKHNHKFELVRTLTSVFGLIVSSIVLLRVFGLI
jgi:hypothetical protein